MNIAEWAVFVGLLAGLVQLAKWVHPLVRPTIDCINVRFGRRHLGVRFPKRRNYEDMPGYVKIDSWEDLRHINKAMRAVRWRRREQA